MTAEWQWKTLGSIYEVTTFRKLGSGSASLTNIAIRSVVANISSLTPETLNDVPWEIGKQIWQRLLAWYVCLPYSRRMKFTTRSKLDSLHAWRVFATAYPGESEASLMQREQSILRPNMALADYVKPITSISHHWLTFLTLSDIICSRSELIQLSQLVNLGVLTIGKNVRTPESNFDDSVIRSWSRSASASGSFSMLRVLSCRMQQDITPRCFEYLASIPSLAFFKLEDCNIGRRDKAAARKLGWKYWTGQALTKLLIDGGLENQGWNPMCQTCFMLGGDQSVQQITAEGVDAINALPVLHFSVGGAPVDPKAVKSFQRLRPSAFKFATPLEPHKRPLSQASQGLALPKKKPTMRSSKHQNLEDLFTGLS